MKLIRRNVSKDSDSFYVVTRDGRRIEDTNYRVKSEAESRALRLCDMLKRWDKTTLNKVAIIQTNSPHKVY
jgi:hypothetical protein